MQIYPEFARNNARTRLNSLFFSEKICRAVLITPCITYNFFSFFKYIFFLRVCFKVNHSKVFLHLFFKNLILDVYAVIDLYGQCAQVSIVSPHVPNIENSQTSQCAMESSHLSLPLPSEVIHRSVP